MAIIREFFHNGGIYYHDFKPDDSVELVCLERGVLLTYKANCEVIKQDGSPLGAFHVEDNKWVFTYQGGNVHLTGAHTSLPEGLLDSEVYVSKTHIDFLDGISNESI